MAKTKGNPTSPQVAVSLENEEKALILRREGYSYSEIARALNIAKSHAHGLVVTGLRRSAEECKESGVVVRQMELDRLDRLLRVVWKPAIEGSLNHIEKAMRIMERRAAYLNLDAPKTLRIEDGDKEVTKKGLASMYTDLKAALTGAPGATPKRVDHDEDSAD